VPKSPDRAAPLLAETGSPRGCRFLRHPFPDCYCLNISGAKIPRMIEYCVGDFGSCQVYRRWARQDAAGAGSPAGSVPRSD